MKTRKVGIDYPSTVIHGTTKRSADAFVNGVVLPISQRQKTYSEWGDHVIYVSEKANPHQALMFGAKGGRGFGGRVMVEFSLEYGSPVMDIADEMVRRPAIGHETTGAALHFCRRPSFTDDMGRWLNDRRSLNNRPAFPKDVAIGIVDPTDGRFSGAEYMPMLANYAMDMGWKAIRLTDETIIVNYSIVTGARIMGKAEVNMLKNVKRTMSPYKYGSLYTEECERF